MADADWRDRLLADVTPEPAVTGGRNPLRWPGYEPRQAMRWGQGRVAGHEVVACVWDFATFGGTFGEVEADAFAAACGRAVAARLPLLTFLRTGGTRLQEGVASLVGIPRAALALERLAAARLPHVSVADHPTTGGMWVGVGSAADLRVGVAGATVGFSGPRVVEAMTGRPVPQGSHTAEGAAAAGLLDDAVPGPQVGDWLARALAALAPHDDHPVPSPAPVSPPPRSGWAQVAAARDAGRPDGAALLTLLLDGTVELRGGDRSVRAAVGRSAAGRRTVGVALAGARGGRPSPAGFALLRRAAETADRIDADLLTLVDTPGADPTAPSEAAGIAPAIAAAMRALLHCGSPTVAVVHGEGGSGGALAAAVADEVLATPTAYFAALAPEGAGSALRLPPEEAADRMGVTPADLAALGFATPAPGEPGALRDAVAARLRDLATERRDIRLARRTARWSAALPGFR